MQAATIPITTPARRNHTAPAIMATVLISVLAVVAVVDVVTVSFSGSVEGSVIVDSRRRTSE